MHFSGALAGDLKWGLAQANLAQPSCTALPQLSSTSRNPPCLMISGMLVGTELASTMDSVVTAQ